MSLGIRRASSKEVSMTEREMEDLIATFPSDFFPRRQLVLKGRQQSFADVGRFDLLFEDEFQTKILMELKARPGKYEDATQLARYKDELERRGERNLLMWLVAPHIPNSVAEVLDRIGIEYTVIHVAEYRRVAERHGVALELDGDGIAGPHLPGPTAAIAADATAEHRTQRSSESVRTQVETGPVVTAPSPLRWSIRGYDLVLVNRDAFDAQKFVVLIDAFEEAVPSRRNARVAASLRRWALDTRLALPLSECQSLLRWVITSGWKSAVPAAEAVWTYLFGLPAPTWQSWSGSKYEFDAAGWKRWYASLPH
jgi:hypothetical protein